jgi:hypothetical protein
MKSTTARPEYVSPDWFRCTTGMAFAAPPPPWQRGDAALTSPNAWERLVAVALRAQSGEFRHASVALQVAKTDPDMHARDCAVRLFALTAPSAEVGQLSTLFAHADYDTRIEAYRATTMAGSIDLAESLARRRRHVGRGEREFVMDNVSDILEVDGQDLELTDSPLDDDAFERRVSEIAADRRDALGAGTFLYQGEPVSAQRLLEKIKVLSGEDDPEMAGGPLANLFCLLEGLTGLSYAGCLDDDCVPMLARIASFQNHARQNGQFKEQIPGRRYFFGHALP